MTARLKRWSAARLRAVAQRLDPQPFTVTAHVSGGSLISFDGLPLAVINPGQIVDTRRTVQ